MDNQSSSTPTTQKPHGGIPKTEFVDDVNAFMVGKTEDVEAVLKEMNEMHSKYSFYENNLNRKMQRLRSKIPDIESNISTINHLLKCKDDGMALIDSHFVLSDSLYAKAKIEPDHNICLWLGANVMVEYSPDEAKQLLAKNLDVANRNVAEINEDLAFLREQMTTLEVNMARVYNWNVERRQKLGQRGAGN